MTKLLESCPNCGGEFEIREIHCRQCGTEIRSHYDPCPFCRLTVEQSNFLELFIQARGNMRTLEQILSVSYPTVRSRIDAIATRLRDGRPDAAAMVAAAQANAGTAAPVADSADAK